MGQKLFLFSFAAVFALLLGVQGYFAFDDNAAKELRAERIGAEFVDRSALAGESIGGLSLYLTVETENGLPSGGSLCVNGIEAGSLERGILTVKAEDGDILTVRNAVGEKVSITDYPADLDRNLLPETVICTENVTKWGKISFR